MDVWARGSRYEAARWRQSPRQPQRQREIDGVDLAWVRGAIHTCTASECAVLLHAGFVKATGRRRRVLGALALGPLWGIFSGTVPVGRNVLRLPLHFCSKDLLGRLRRNLHMLRIKFFITWVK